MSASGFLEKKNRLPPMARGPPVDAIFAQSRRKKTPSCATNCAIIHIETRFFADQFALMHAHSLSNTGNFPPIPGKMASGRWSSPATR
jgi:hypothetical protein